MKIKRHFSISATEFSTIWPARSYLNDDYKFDVECTVKSDNHGFFKMKYFIMVEGEKQNIADFIEYLKHEGFKVG